MVGLPFEAHEDVEAIVTLTAQIRERMLKVARGRGRIGRIHPSVNPFIPKPGTPYQWLPMEDPKETDRKLQYLRKAFARMPNVDAICKSARTGAVQSVLAVGDRRVGDALELQATQGLDLKRALRESGLDPAFYLFRRRPKQEALPWDLVDNGVSKDYFWRELVKSEQGQLSPALPGAAGLHPLRRLHRDAEPDLRGAREVEGPGRAAALREAGGEAGLSLERAYSGRLRQCRS